MAEETVLVVIHPGAACAGADERLGDGSAVLRDALAAEIMAWQSDMVIIDCGLSAELQHYALLGIAIDGARDRGGRTVVRQAVERGDPARWPDAVRAAVIGLGRHDPECLVTGAWRGNDEKHALDEIVEVLGRDRATISPNALRLP